MSQRWSCLINNENVKSYMDGCPAMETDTGRAVMKTPEYKDKALFNAVKPTQVAITLSISRAVDIDNHLASKYSK